MGSMEERGDPFFRLIDTHAHLDEVQDLEGALKRAQDAGIQAIVGVGTDLASNEKILQLAVRFPNLVLPAVGLHPWRLEKIDPAAQLGFIEKELPRCVALGEVGLDFALKTPREEQEDVLRGLLALAQREKKPVLLHARRAWTEALGMLKMQGIERAIFHWYSGPLDILQQVIAQGYWVSATPAAAYSERHRLAIQAAPLDQLVLETDAPESYRGARSEPKDLLKTLQAVSELKGQPPGEIARHTYRNSLDFFRLNGFLRKAP
jgi:TatD DNase family protein